MKIFIIYHVTFDLYKLCYTIFFFLVNDLKVILLRNNTFLYNFY